MAFDEAHNCIPGLCSRPPVLVRLDSTKLQTRQPAQPGKGPGLVELHIDSLAG